MDKKVIIAIVAVVAVIAAGAAVMLTNNGGSDEPDEKVTLVNRLVVYGNANNDNFLDEKDRAFVKNIVDGKTTWDKTANPYADADHDGKITQKDVDTIDKFLKGEKATMYYTDWNNETSHIGFPITGNIATSYSIGLDVAIIGGFYDNVTRLLKVQSYVDALDPVAYPNPDKRIASMGTKYDYDSVVANKLNLLTGDEYCYNSTVMKQLEEAEALGSETYVLKLPIARSINGKDLNTTIVTAGVMTMNQAKTKAYIDYLDSIDKEIYEKITSKGTEVKPLNYMYLYIVNGNQFTLRVPNSTGVDHSAVANINMLPLKNVASPTSNGGVEVTMDDVIKYNPDVIFCINTEWVFSTQTDAEFKANVKTMFDAMSTTNAFKNGAIYYIGYELIGSAPYLPALTLLASYLWPETFDQKEAFDMIQYFYDNFTHMKFDVRNSHLAPLTKADIYP